MKFRPGLVLGENLDGGPVMCAVTTGTYLDGICRPTESVMVQYVHGHHLPPVGVQYSPQAIVESLRPTNTAGLDAETRTGTTDDVPAVTHRLSAGEK